VKRIAANLRRAERARGSDPARALGWAGQALALSGLPSSSPTGCAPRSPADIAVRLVACRLVDVDGATVCGRPVAASGAGAVPSAAAAAGRPLTRFADVAAFEAAVWGRRLSA
jgi:hypothetical protein